MPLSLEGFRSELTAAMKAKDELRVTTLRFLISKLQNAKIDAGSQLDEAAVMQVIRTQVKQRQESIDQFRQAGRQDLVAREEQELSIIKAYLPAALSEDDVRVMVKAAIASAGAKSKKDMGLVMKAVMAQVQGRADGKLVSRIVGEELP